MATVSVRYIVDDVDAAIALSSVPLTSLSSRPRRLNGAAR